MRDDRTETPQLVDEREAARILGLRPQTLTNWRSTRSVALPYVRLGRRAIRYRRCDLISHIKQHMVGAPTA